MRWPLPGFREIPEKGSPGSFGAIRHYDIHTGIDLYVPVGTPVLSVEAGIVTNVLPFTGPEASSPWWLPTKAIMVQGEHTICYGEIEPVVSIGEAVEPGQQIGSILQVLRTDKGNNPVSMLHFELYMKGTLEPIWWYLDTPKPECLLEPTSFLTSLK